jgi:hypothetical protein
MIEHLLVVVLVIQLAYVTWRCAEWRGQNVCLRFQRDCQQRAIGEMWAYLYDNWPWQDPALKAQADEHKCLSGLAEWK